MDANILFKLKIFGIKLDMNTNPTFTVIYWIYYISLWVLQITLREAGNTEREHSTVPAQTTVRVDATPLWELLTVQTPSAIHASATHRTTHPTCSTTTTCPETTSADSCSTSRLFHSKLPKIYVIFRSTDHALEKRRWFDASWNWR